MKKFLKIVGILILIVILIIVILLAYLGFVPGLSTLFGANKPRNLGVSYTEKDLTSAQNKLSQKLIDAPTDPYKTFSKTEGTPVDIKLTQEEYSAHVERIHPVSDIQIKLDGDSFEMSGRIDKSRIPAFARTWGLTNASDKEILDAIDKYVLFDPIFYIAGTGGVVDNKLTIDLSKAELGRFPVPSDQAEEVLKAYTETLFSQIPAFSVENSTVENGQLQFKGSTAKEVPKY